MTLPRLVAINERWRLTPPLSVSTAAIAICLGAIKAPGRTDGQRAPEQAANDEAMGDLLALMGGVTTEMPEWLRQGMTNPS